MRTKELELTLYYDLYGSQLTARQQEVFQLYYNEDLSLSEIAAMMSTSRQAVSDTLTRAKKKLQQLETSLGLVQRKRDEDGI